MTRHTDAAVNKLLRDWGLRGDLEATKAAYEAQDFDELMRYFRDAHRGHGIADFTRREQSVTRARTGETVAIDLATTLKHLYFVRPDAGEIRYVAAAARYTYGRPANRVWFERMKAMRVDDIHAFLDVRKQPLADRGAIHDLIDSVRDGIDPSYVGGLPLAYDGFNREAIKALWDGGIPAAYAATIRTGAPRDGVYPQYSTSDIQILHEAGIPARYAAVLQGKCSLKNVIRYCDEGIPAEFALEL